jgi:TonB-linked SusC/RagA family outer membrane protein
MKHLTKNLTRQVLWAVLWLFSLPLAAQTIQGKISDAQGNPLIGAGVVLEGTTKGAVADDSGNYKLDLAGADKNGTLVFSYVGFETQKVAIGGRTAIDIVLSESQALSEVVVVGYGTTTKKDLTGAVVSIKGKDLLQVPAPNAISSLQGLVAGVDIAATNNTPGATPSIRIRGNRSINASNDPLIVVDGLPFNGSLNDLNSGDIKSMEVLKDASATAIYGSRGANGVVLITTNRGTSGKMQINYNGYYGSQTPLNQPRLMTGAEYAEFRREAQRNVTPTTRYASATPNANLDKTMFFVPDANVVNNVLKGYDANGNYDPNNVPTTDWLSEATRTGVMQDHQISVLMGTEKMQTSLSAGYFKNDGVVKGFGFERFNIRLSVDNQLNKIFKIGGTFSTSLNSNRSTDNIYERIGVLNPLAPARDADGVLITEIGSDASTFNPLLILEGRFSEAKSKRFFGSLFLEANILDGLKYRVNYSPDYRTSSDGFFSTSRASNGNPAAASRSFNQQFHYVLDNMLIYDKTFNNKHRIGVTLLQSLEEDRFDNVRGAVSDIPYENQLFYNLGTANQVSALTSGLNEWALSSFMGRLNYGFNSKYLLTLTGRYDGSSRLAKGNKWSFFPSAALAWNASEEAFIQKLNVFTELKVRASYGLTGNTAINPYQTLGGLSRTVYATDDLPAFGFQPNLITNPNLGWEKTAQANFGVDFGILKDRVTGSIDVYQQNTSDLLLARQLPTASGFSSIVENVGATRNSGIEFLLRGVILNKPSSGLRWTTQVMFTRNKEEIVSLYKPGDDVGNRWFIGQPVVTYFDYKKIGIFQNTDADKAAMASYNARGSRFTAGTIKIQDTNGDSTINALDRVILGSAVPKWIGSFNSNFEFKGFDLNFLIFARIGQTISDEQGILYEGRENWLKVDYWTPTNPTNSFPKPIAGTRTPDFASTIGYQDGSFVRLRNVTLGYKLPDSMLKKMRISNFRVYVSALNAYLRTNGFRGIDPEGSTGITTPSVTTYMTGLNLSF